MRTSKGRFGKEEIGYEKKEKANRRRGQGRRRKRRRKLEGGRRNG